MPYKPHKSSPPDAKKTKKLRLLSPKDPKGTTTPDIKASELGSPSIAQPSAIKIISALDKNKSKPQAGRDSANKAFEMKKIPSNTTKKDEKKKTWIAKTPKNTSPYEVIGQETLRFLSPTKQPKTRFWNNAGTLGVISEKLPFRGIEKETKMKTKFTSDFLQGLGAGTLFSLFTNETDLKLAHIDAKTGTKIDGDWMFSSLSEPARFEKLSSITATEINSLPYVDKYSANNWLDQIAGGIITSKDLLFAKPEYQKDIRQGINQSIMHILLLPNRIVIDFVQAYIKEPILAQKISAFLIDRKEQLLNASLQNDNFLSFLKEFKDPNPYIEKIQGFIPYKHDPLIDSSNYRLKKDEIPALLNQLKKAATSKKASPTSPTKEKYRDDNNDKHKSRKKEVN